MAARNLQLTIAGGDYDRTRALRDGRVPVDGCDITYLPLEPEELFFRAARYADFDVCEYSMSTYLMQWVRGTTPYVALPVFLSRVFRHSGFYIRTDRGITSPADLRGKTIGVPEYQMTASVWQRGLLEDEYGVSARDVAWRSGGQEQPGRVERSPFTPPDWLDLKPIPGDRTLSGMLAAGELDALITARPPSCFLDGAPNVGRLWPDFRAAEQDYFRRTRIHPIMHMVVVRRSLVEANPWLPATLMKAFVQAKSVAVASLERGAALSVTLPWIVAELAATREVLGRDIWPYGLAACRHEVAALIRYSHVQGLIDRMPEPEELFHPSTHLLAAI
jgi:4,5-dihydroxyphthalate decarboxylase